MVFIHVEFTRVCSSVIHVHMNDVIYLMDLLVLNLEQACLLHVVSRAHSIAAVFRYPLLFCRATMTKLVRLDILSSEVDTETGIQHPAGKPFMLAFVNIAANGGAVTSDDGSTLKTALTFLCNNLHDRGTVVIALPDWEFNRTKLKGDTYVHVSLLPIEGLE